MANTTSISSVVNNLSNQSSRLIDTIERLGDAIPHGSALGDAMLNLMDIVLEMDNTIEDTQRVLAYMGRRSMRGRRLNDEEQEELMQSRRERRRWEEEKQTMERKIAAMELRVSCLQELNNMLLDRARSTTPAPSSGYSSASHSPRSIEEESAANVVVVGAPADVVQQKAEPPVSIPPPKPERRQLQPKLVLNLDFTPECESTTFKDSMQLSAAPKKVASCVDLNKKTPVASDLNSTIQLSDSPEAPNEGPLCSTYREERSIYHTPATSKKMRRRSSSLGDVMKKIFTPKQKVKNPILEEIAD
ncbi:hypothetical protein PRIPAC_89082 [Pristionchus pacificus]|uniref:Uncharacterized protein n=1 Tax=Pristionchus pacificus TaxID=54126 RepID=A0A2A6CXC3_PRIPA|nr:hypothetical protein PRIPAC_89082 [Pristionchus pacificus]|eukprot:PDM82683.1 hypothetical protein PRIPAC_37076 [Pristionchus pacificus]